jgi:hypothetical protein
VLKLEAFVVNAQSMAISVEVFFTSLAMTPCRLEWVAMAGPSLATSNQTVGEVVPKTRLRRTIAISLFVLLYPPHHASRLHHPIGYALKWSWGSPVTYACGASSSMWRPLGEGDRTFVDEVAGD